MGSAGYTTDDVYGIARDIPLNYVARRDVDLRLVENLTRDKHIVIHGGSKQGKTCLRKHCLKDEDYVLIQCSNKWSLADINANILKRADFEVTQSTKKTTSGRNKIIASFKAKVLGVGVGLSGEKESAEAMDTTVQPLELDIEDVNDVIAALQSINFSKYIVLEDFHYLLPEVQRDFAVALKAFHEASRLCFIIVGVWLEENRLIVYNGDLTGRVISINADTWQPAELRAVIDKGAEFLGVQFDASFVEELVAESFDSVSIVQEVCREACRKHSVFRPLENQTVVGLGLSAKQLVRDVIAQQGARYRTFIHNFADGFQHTALEMYRWLLYPLLTSEIPELEKGIRYNQLRTVIQSKHPQGKDLNAGNLTQALQSTASLQIKKGIKPLIIDYDETNRRLNVVDRGFYIWRANQAKPDLLEEAGLPA